jgi:acyl-CoA thioesterase
VVDIRTSLPSVGKYTTQARATILKDGEEILTATAALGERDGLNGQWAVFPDVPDADMCEEHPHWGDTGTMSHRIRFRPANGYFGDRGPPDGKGNPEGRMQVWMRPAEDIAIDRIVLAVIADFFSPGIRNATGRWAGGNSLDNTIRYCRMVATEWVLCDIQVEAIADGIVHGSMRLFAQTGELMAVASQSMIVRVRD